MSRAARHMVSRFWDRVSPGETCWKWTGAKNGKGYGVLRANYPSSKNVLAHRASYLIHHGPISDGLFVLHKCDVPECVCPFHLFLGTNEDNVRDMIAKGRSKSGQHQAAKTHCPNGHPYNELNTIFRKNSSGGVSRHCRRCRINGHKAWRKNRKESNRAI